MAYRFGVATLLAGADYGALRDTWQAVDGTDIDLITFWDHYMPPFGDPTAKNHEVWTLLAGVASATQRVRFAPAVLSTVRQDPARIANAAVTLDHMSNGRIELGFGAGGPPDEANRYGQPLPPPGERVARLGESIDVVKKLWTENSVTHEGRFFQLQDAICNPKPVQSPIPITVAGGGDRSLRIAASQAQGWRAFGTTGIESFAALNQRVDAACQAVGRDPSTLERADAITPPPDWWASDPDAGVATLRAAADAGMTCMIFPARMPADGEAIRRFASTVLGQFKASLP